MTCDHDKRFQGVFFMPKGDNGCVACGYERASAENSRLKVSLEEYVRLDRAGLIPASTGLDTQSGDECTQSGNNDAV